MSNEQVEACKREIVHKLGVAGASKKGLATALLDAAIAAYKSSISEAESSIRFAARKLNVNGPGKWNAEGWKRWYNHAVSEPGGMEAMGVKRQRKIVIPAIDPTMFFNPWSVIMEILTGGAGPLAGVGGVIGKIFTLIEKVGSVYEKYDAITTVMDTQKLTSKLAQAVDALKDAIHEQLKGWRDAIDSELAYGDALGIVHAVRHVLTLNARLNALWHERKRVGAAIDELEHCLWLIGMLDKVVPVQQYDFKSGQLKMLLPEPIQPERTLW